MRKRKKSRFWTFCFSFIPGAAEMYMGFMKMGLSIMSVFGAIIFITAVLDCGPVLFAGVVAWFYGFFHARNFAAMSQEEIDCIEDSYLINFSEEQASSLKNKLINQKLFAYGLIGIGVFCLWKGFFRGVYIAFPRLQYGGYWRIEDIVSRLLEGILIVLAGIYLIRGKQKELFEQIETDEMKDMDGVQMVKMIESEEEGNHGRETESKNA